MIARKTKIWKIFIFLVFLFYIFLSCQNTKKGEKFQTNASQKEEKPSFLLITIDTWRSDYIGISGSGKVETPNIDRIARKGLYIKNCESPCPATTPAHASILTGLYPKNHGIRDNHHFKLKDEVKTLPLLLREKGYKTIGVVSGAPLRSVYGINKGFDYYDDLGLGAKGDESLSPSSRNGEVSANIAIDLIKSAANYPLFVWLHLYEPHRPYNPPSEYAVKYKNNLYAGEVAYADAIIGNILDKVMNVKKGRWIIIITSDHGEGLGDNIELTHGFLLFKETRRVPLIYYDTNKEKIEVAKGIKSLIDIAPTIAEAANIEANFDGTSIFKESSERKLLSETILPMTSFSVNGAYSVRDERKIYIKHGVSKELYLDGEEKNNIYSEKELFAKEMERIIQNNFENESFEATLRLTSEELSALKSLGYIANATMSEKKVKKCDLKEFTRDFNKFEYGRGFLASGKYNEGLPYYDEFLKKYPYAPVAFLEKGMGFANLGRFDEAKESFKKCLSLDPKNSTAFLNLGNIFVMEKKYDEAEKSYLKCLSYEEEAEAHLNLGLLYYQFLKNKIKAEKHLKRFIELVPDDPEKDKILKLITDIQKS